MFLLIDNYDSFTYNLVHFLGELGVTCDVRRNDTLTVDEAIALAPEAIVISPGPSDPDHAGICLDLVKKAAEIRMPLFGVCLGHQAIGQAFGGKVVRAQQLMHGKLSDMTTTGKGLFEGLPATFRATRYHSLVVEESSLPDCFEITARADDGEIMGIAHRAHPVVGVQFHPEVVHTPDGAALLANFVNRICGCGGAWTMAAFRDAEIVKIREQVGDARVICGLSGGVDCTFYVLFNGIIYFIPGLPVGRINAGQ